MAEAILLPPPVEGLIKSELPEDTRLISSESMQTYLREFAEDPKRHPDLKAEICKVTDAFHNEHEYFSLSAEVENGACLYLADGMHSDEHDGRLTSKVIFDMMRADPSLMSKLGLSRIIYFDADPEGTAMNDPKIFTKQTPDIHDITTGTFRSGMQPHYRFPGEIGNYRHEPDETAVGTNAIQAILEKEKVDIIIPLHNAKLGQGDYTQVSHNQTDLHDQISEVTRRLKLPASRHTEIDFLTKGRHWRDGIRPAATIHDWLDANPSWGFGMTIIDALHYASEGHENRSITGISETPSMLVRDLDMNVTPEQARANIERMERAHQLGTQSLESLSITPEILDVGPRKLYDSVARSMDNFGIELGEAREIGEISEERPLHMAALLGRTARLAGAFQQEETSQNLQDSARETISIYDGRVEYVPLQTRVRKILGVIAVLSNARKEGAIDNSHFALNYPETT